MLSAFLAFDSGEIKNVLDITKDLHRGPIDVRSHAKEDNQWLVRTLKMASGHLFLDLHLPSSPQLWHSDQSVCIAGGSLECMF